MDDINLGQGTHSVAEIDAAVDDVKSLETPLISSVGEKFAVVYDDGSLGRIPIADGYSAGAVAADSIAKFKDVYDYYSANRTKARSACTGVFISNVSSLPVTHTQLVTSGATLITADYWCVSMRLTNPAAQTGDWTVTTGDRTVTVSGTISGTTDIILFLADPYWA